MRLQFVRNRGLGPASLIGRLKGHPARQKISRRRLESFVDQMERGPRVSLSSVPPGSIAIVVPCFRHASYLSEMLESIASQIRPPDEVIFIDDCSPDATSEILGDFIARHSSPPGPRWRLLVNDRNVGQAASLNLGIAVASSDLVMVLNDDDYLMHDAVASALALFHGHPELALVAGHHVEFAGREALAASPKTSSAHTGSNATLVIHRPDEVRTYPFVDQLDMTHSGMSVLKAVWDAVGGYRPNKDERVAQYSDRDFQFRVAALWPVGVAQDTAFAFWRNDSSVDRLLNS